MKKLTKILLAGFLFFYPSYALAAEKNTYTSDKVSIASLYKWNEKTKKDIIKESDSLKEPIYVFSQGYNICNENLMSILYTKLDRDIYHIPVTNKNGFSHNDILKNEQLLMFYLIALNKRTVELPLIITKQGNKVIYFEGVNIDISQLE